MFDMNKIIVSLVLGLCMSSGHVRLQAASIYVKVPLAIVQGAMAAGCMLTSVACIRACIKKEFKVPSMAIDSLEVRIQPDIRSKALVLIKGIGCNMCKIVAGAAEFAVLKTVTLSAGVATGVLGVYLTRKCIGTVGQM